MRNFAKSGINRYRIRRGELASTDEMLNNGAFVVHTDKKTGLFIIASDDTFEEVTKGWEHVSVHVKRVNNKGRTIMRTPTWKEMCLVKEMFFEDNECVVQFHPPKSSYVNQHEHCLHLWHHVDGFAMPPIELV